MPSATYAIKVDWDADGTFAGTGEDVSARLRFNPQLVIRRGREMAKALSPPAAGRFDFTLDNQSGDYSSQNAASPIFGRVLPGREVCGTASYGGTAYALGRAYVEEPIERPSRGEKYVTFNCLDGLSFLRAAKVSTAMYTGITTDVAIGHVLDAAGWPAGKRSLQTGKTTLARWWVDNVDAFTAIRDLVNSEGPGALFYCDEVGNVVFEDRHYRLLTSRCTTSQATLRDSGAEPLFSGYNFLPGIRDVVNAATIPVRSFASSAGVSIWTASGLPITLAPGEVRRFTVDTTADGFSAAVVTLTASAGSASNSLDRASGKSATLTVTAHATTGATLSALSVTATTWTISSQNVANTIDAATSQSKYGERALPTQFVGSWVPDVNTATDLANAVVARYREPVPQVQVTLNNAAAARLVQCLTRKPSDRVTIVQADSSVNDDFMVEAIEHRVSFNQNHETTFVCEQSNQQAFWILGVAGYSELGETTVLGY